jgi:hypothetical protein
MSPPAWRRFADILAGAVQEWRTYVEQKEKSDSL